MVGRSADDHMAGVPHPQFLRLGREPEECIDLSLREKRQRVEGRAIGIEVRAYERIVKEGAR